MIFRARNIVFILSVAAFVFAEESNKKDLAPSNTNPSNSTNLPVDPQPIPTSSPNSTTITPAPTTTTSSTPKPTTTSTATPTTTPTTPTTTPIPTPQPKNQTSWIVRGTNGTVCIMADMVINIDIPYICNDNKTIVKPFSVSKVQDANASGTCIESTAESLVLKWDNVTTTFNFISNATEKIYSLDSVKISINVNNFTFPNHTMNVSEVVLTTTTNKLFSVSQNNSYTCANMKPLTLVPNTNATLNGTLTITKVHVQAFGTETTEKYRAPLDCVSPGHTPDIIPMIVGGVLGGLVVIVLVAYLVGRKRAQSRGYLSM